MSTTPLEDISLRNLSTSELLRTVNRDHPQVRELARRLEIALDLADDMVERARDVASRHREQLRHSR